MRLLKEDANSIEFLRYEVFGALEWDSMIEAPGKLIAHECSNGPPLAIIADVGGIISRKVSAIVGDNEKVAAAWEKFEKTVVTHLVIDDPKKIMEKVISSSYKKLPYHLKACFEILTWKLFRMWIAEGFVQEKNFGLKETAAICLDELVRRNLVIADEQRSSNGKIKTCLIHDSLQEYCKMQAGEDDEGFFEEIKRSTEDEKLPLLENNTTCCRRLCCVHTNILQFISAKPFGSRVRSLVCFSGEDLTLESQCVSAIPGGFELRRVVLDTKPIKLTSDILYELHHLRYIHLSFDSAILPQPFSQLLNTQTLIVDTSIRILEIKADIWKMRHLRHLKTNTTATLPEPTKTVAEDVHSIQALGTIAPESCTDKVLNKACNLKRVMSIRGDLRVAPNLRILTLSYTSLDKLELLELKAKAFVGNYQETVDGGFHHLRVLFIGRTDLIVRKTFARHFPALVRLELQDCDFVKLRSLKVLDLIRCQTAAASGKEFKRPKTVEDPSVEFDLTPY